MTDTIKLSPSTWTTSSTTMNTGSASSDDITNAISTSLNSLFGALNTVGFLNSSKNLQTALEDFGQGLTAALACVSSDLIVVGSGLVAAATAFSSLDRALANTFTQLDTQLDYYTNTVTTIQLPTASASANAALNSLSLPSSSSSASSSFWDSTGGHILIGAGIVVGVIAVGAVIVLTLPIDAIVAAGSAVVAGGAALFSALGFAF